MKGIAIGIKYKRKAVKYIRISGIYRVKLVKYGVRWGVCPTGARERRVRHHRMGGSGICHPQVA